MQHVPMMTILLLLALATSIAMAAPQTAKAGKYSVTLATHPEQPIVGDNHVTFTVKDGKKPVKDADVSLHIDMVGMSMPADVKATPGSEDGQYVATVNLGMEGQWKLTVAVNAMAGMTMEGDGKATFTVTAQKAADGSASTSAMSSANMPAQPAAPAAPAGLPWPLILGGIVVVGIVVVVVVVARGRSQQTPGA